MNAHDAIKKYIEIRDLLEARNKKRDEADKPYRDAMQALEGFLAQQFNEMGTDSIACRGVGTAYRSKLMSTKVADRGTFLGFVFDNKAEQFLTSAVSKEAVKDYIEQHQTPPPGIDVTFIHKINFRRDS